VNVPTNSLIRVCCLGQKNLTADVHHSMHVFERLKADAYKDDPGMHS
jgi:hypothetical protein